MHLKVFLILFGVLLLLPGVAFGAAGKLSATEAATVVTITALVVLGLLGFVWLKGRGRARRGRGRVADSTAPPATSAQLGARAEGRETPEGRPPLAGFIRASRWMIDHIALPVGLAMIAGLAVGYFTPHEVAMRLQFTIIIGLFWMLYPMMINLRMGKLFELIRLPKQMGLSLGLNFIVSPLVIGVLVLLFLKHNPVIGAGLMLVGVSPCSAMNTAATAFVGGNIELTLVIIAVSYLLTIVAAPFWVTVFMHKAIPVPFVFMMRQIAFVILIPMLAGWLTRLLLERRLGERRYGQIVPSFQGFSFLGVLFMIFFLFVINGRNIVTHWQILLVVIGASLAFFALMMFLGIFVPKLFRLNYEDSSSITVTTVAKNESIAMALAFLIFGPQAALGVAIGGVLIQVPFMVAYIQGISKRLRGFYRRAEEA